jgi:peroxiredoxin
MAASMRCAPRALILVTCLLGAVFSAVASAQTLTSGMPAPEFDLPVLDGGRLSLASQRGHAVVVTFWGTWCPPCRDEFPQLVRVHREQRALGLQVLAVNGLDQESGTKPIQKFVSRYGVTFPVLLDERGRMRELYHITGLPMTVFIDSGGVIRRVKTGPISPAALDSGVAEIMRRSR